MPTVSDQAMLHVRRVAKSTAPKMAIGVQSVKLNRLLSRPRVGSDQDLSVARRLAAIVDNSEDAIIGKDLNSIITSWNKAAERIFGYSAEEMVGTSIVRLIPAERRREEDEILSRIKRGERYDHFDTIRVTKDGRQLHVSLTISPIKDANGYVVGASKIARDITERKLAENAQK